MSFNFNEGVVIKIGHFHVTVKQVHNWYCVYIRVPYVEGCNDIGTYCELLDNGECIIGEDTAKSWLNYTDFASVYIMANALIENYCELRDNDYNKLLTMITGE
jgi:hypothetical protein